MNKVNDNSTLCFSLKVGEKISDQKKKKKKKKFPATEESKF